MSDQIETDPAAATVHESPMRYATFTRRFRALVVDSSIVFGFFIALLLLGDAASAVPASGRLTWFLIVAVLLLYEPVLVSRRGATIGHALNQIEVVDARTGHWPSFTRSFARYLIKAVVGVPSFVTMAVSRRHQAIHDLLTQTIVRLPAGADSAEFHLERSEDAAEPASPDMKAALEILDAQMADLHAQGLGSGSARDSYLRQRRAILRGQITVADLSVDGAASPPQPPDER